jgi:hypothetical protein
MSDKHDDDTTTISLELPARLAARLKQLRDQFGDELVADLVEKAAIAVEGKLALRGAIADKNHK